MVVNSITEKLCFNSFEMVFYPFLFQPLLAADSNYKRDIQFNNYAPLNNKFKK